MNKINSKEIGKIGKIIIPNKIEQYIDTLHKKVGNTEWSGILFYKLTGGNIKTLKNLEFTVEFLYPMNIGSSAYTEFEYNNNVMNAYDIKEDLIECSNSLIHSHHSMSAFFSGTDTDELLTNAKNFNYYISLIVNFNKNYVCKIAFPSKSTVTKKYQIKGDDGKLFTVNSKEEIDEILVADLVIEFENAIIEEPWLISRIEELKKPVNKIPTSFNNVTIGGVERFKRNDTYPTKINPYRQLDAWDDWDNYDIPLASTQKMTAVNFLNALLNLDESKKNYSTYSTLDKLKGLNDEEVEILEDAYALNLLIIYEQIFPEDLEQKNLSNICMEAIKELNKYTTFQDEIAVVVTKEMLKEYV